MSIPLPLDGGSRSPLAGVPLDLYRLARRYRQAKWSDLLGRPRTESSILQGRFPLAPERVLTIPPAPAVGVEELGRWEEIAAHYSPLMPRVKVHALVDVMANLAAHYNPARFTRTWTRGLIQREALGSTGIGRGFALVHQFQARESVPVAHPPVDWWLILCPAGIEWEALDGQPVYGMFAHVFADRDHPGLELRVFEKACRLAREVDWQALASREPEEVTATVNRRLLELVAG
jgi:mannitol/fructose-specific phosphotransferase system IIA component (Ntr-type)